MRPPQTLSVPRMCTPSTLRACRSFAWPSAPQPSVRRGLGVVEVGREGEESKLEPEEWLKDEPEKEKEEEEEEKGDKCEKEEEE